MITVYEGGLGSGKTYDAVRRIIANIKKGRRILTNIDGFQKQINNETIKHICNIDDYDFEQKIIFLSNDDVIHFWDIAKPNDLIVIDETQNFFGSRNWQSQQNASFLKWATEHRHHGQDCLLISPKRKMIDAQVRSMSEWIYSYRKMNMFGGLFQKKYVRFAYYETDDMPIGKPKICTYDSTIFKCYSSYFVQEAKEIGIEKGANILKHPVFFTIPIVIGLFIYFLMGSSIMGNGVFGNKSISNNDKKVITDNQNQSLEDSMESEQPKIDSDYSQKKNIIGIINGKKMIKTDKGIIFE